MSKPLTKSSSQRKNIKNGAKGKVKANPNVVGKPIVDVETTPIVNALAVRPSTATAITKNDTTDQLQLKSIDVAAKARLMIIRDDESLISANALLIGVAQTRKDLENHRTALLKPFKDHIKNIEAKYFRSPLAVLDEADALMRRKVLDYRELQRQQAEKIRFEAEAKAQAAAEEAARLAEEGEEEEAAEAEAEATQQAIIAVQASAPARRMVVGDTQVSARKSWQFKIIDLGAIPDEYWEVNLSAIRGAIRSGIRSIPGVEIFEAEVLAVGGM